jgi:hypothetical protein
MLVHYDDVISRINENPTWYTTEGYPRYGEFEPGSCSIYADFSVLMEIGCQSCGDRFFIGRDYESMDRFETLIDMTKVEFSSGFKPQKDAIWINIRHAHYAPKLLGENGKPQYRTLDLKDLVQSWGFGDPPNHGCVGDTMGCVEIRCVQAWDMRFGQESALSENGKYTVLTKFGVPTRIAEIEGFEFEKHDWYPFYD